jgi:hypothetical protein
MHLFSVGLDVTKARETAFITLGVRHATQKRSTCALIISARILPTTESMKAETANGR